jgi:hypothetical protein
MCDLLWSDPDDRKGWGISPRFEYFENILFTDLKCAAIGARDTLSVMTFQKCLTIGMAFRLCHGLTSLLWM